MMTNKKNFSTTHNDGEIQIELSDNTAGNEGHLFYTHVSKGGAVSKCVSAVNYMDDEWHHFVATGVITGGTCKLYVDGTLDDTTTSGNNDHLHNPNDIFIGAKDDLGKDSFTGHVDDIMLWINHTLSQTDVTALYQTSFGKNAHQLNFYLNNATGDGTTVDNLAISLNYPLPYVDVGRYTAVNDLWAGGNYTINLPLLNLTLAAPNRLNFTISYAGGLPMNLNIDKQDLDGSINLLSTYLQIPPTDDPLPVFVDIGRFSKITLFAFNVGDKGAWFTSQGTRLVFNGTNGNYASIVDTISNGVDPVIKLNGTQDSPFVANNQKADIIFWQPQKTPVAGSPPTPDDHIPAGNYELTVFLNGYDEDGISFLRSIALGTVKVVE